MRLQGRVKRVIGVDIDPAVHENSALDEAHTYVAPEPLPLADGSVDLIISDWTFEHITDPATAAAELGRVLRAGGCICARTPNRHGYISLANRLVPTRFHSRVLARVQPDRQERDKFPAAYLLNTSKQVAEHFPIDRFEVLAYSVNPEPAYFGASVTAWRLVNAIGKVLPQRLGATWHFFIRKRAT